MRARVPFRNNVRRCRKAAGGYQRIEVRTSTTWQSLAFEVFGATTVQLPHRTVRRALEEDIINAQEGLIYPIEELRSYEIQKKLALTYHGYSLALLLVDLHTWSELSTDAQRALQDAAAFTQEFSFREGERVEAESIKRLRLRGLDVTDVDRMAFQEASKYVYDQLASKVPDDGQLIADSLRLQ